MPDWITISADDLNDKLVAAQVSAIRLAAKGAGQTSRDQCITDVIQRIRRKIENHNLISATPDTIPAELRSMAIYLAIAELQTAIPGLSLTDDQKDRIATMEADLQRIADGKDSVAAPTNPLTPPESQAASHIIKILKTPTQNLNRERLKGL